MDISVNLIEVKDAGFSYGNEPILRKIEFSINKGDFAALVGANGAGKSTLFRMLLGELLPMKGSVRIFGEDASKRKDWSKIGYMPQLGFQAGMAFPATVEEVVQANLYSQIGLLTFPKKEHREKVIEALRLTGMETERKKLIGNLSGGQQQRVWLSRVLVNEPELMLLDEPTTGVDIKSVESLLHLLHHLNLEKKLTILMITHDLARVSDTVSRVFCLENGSLVELSKSQIHEEFSHRHKHPDHRDHAEEI